mgnify:CR=1 FL=1
MTGVQTCALPIYKDLTQLVNEHVSMVDTMNGKHRDVAGVTAEFGVPPDLMLDYQTLVGDAVDNVPGVPKVGPKTAAKWLQEYGNLENLLAHAGDIKGVAGENLRNAVTWLPTARQLLKIRTDCDLSGHVSGLPDLSDLVLADPQAEALADFYSRYGFKTLAAKAAEGKPAINIADTRTWTTLPKQIQVCRLPTPSDRKLTLDGVRFADAGRRLVALSLVDNETQLLFWDLTRPEQAPKVIPQDIEGGRMDHMDVSQDGRWVSAIELLKSYVQNNGGSANVDQAHYLLGMSYLKNKDWALAAGEFDGDHGDGATVGLDCPYHAFQRVAGEIGRAHV